jgi:multidrug resistance efflux pump
MEPLPPIPADPQTIHKLIRQRVLPPLVFLGLVGVTVWLWGSVASTPTLLGVGEGIKANVCSPQAGLVTEFKVQPYQLVKEGDPIVVFQPQDPRLRLDVLQAEIALARLRQEPSQAEQNAMNYQRVRVEFLRLKAELAVARVNLKQAQNQVDRNLPLYKEKVLSEELYDLSVQARDAFNAEVAEKDAAVKDMEQRLEELRGLGDPGAVPPNTESDRLLARLAESWETNQLGPITLVAPVSGMVMPMGKQPGEFAVEGEPLVGIQSVRSERVVAYLRQPYPLDPEVGMKVRVTTRGPQRVEFLSSVSHVGAQVEVITNALAFVRQGALVDVGLPIVLELPPQSRIRPGEMVDLRFERTAGDMLRIAEETPAVNQTTAPAL